jgi:hypothetical protein
LRLPTNIGDGKEKRFLLLSHIQSQEILTSAGFPPIKPLNALTLAGFIDKENAPYPTLRTSMRKAVALIFVLTLSAQASAQTDADNYETVKRQYEQLKSLESSNEGLLSLSNDLKEQARIVYEKTKQHGSSKAEQEEAKRKYLKAQKEHKKAVVRHREFIESIKLHEKLIKEADSKARSLSPNEVMELMLRNGVTEEEIAATAYRGPEGDAARAKILKVAKKERVKVTFDVQ